MPATERSTHRGLATVEIDGRRLEVSLAVEYDGVEYVGRLWFEEAAAPGTAITDRGAIPGRTPAAALALAEQLTPVELEQRYRRGVAERRQYRGLRRVTGEVLGKIRGLNRVATSMRAGLMDAQDAAREIAVAEAELHELVGRLRDVAGADDGEGTDRDHPAGPA
jgi:hypothetical protein